VNIICQRTLVMWDNIIVAMVMILNKTFSTLNAALWKQKLITYLWTDMYIYFLYNAAEQCLRVIAF
jgi:hypothetical protein